MILNFFVEFRPRKKKYFDPPPSLQTSSWHLCPPLPPQAPPLPASSTRNRHPRHQCGPTCPGLVAFHDALAVCILPDCLRTIVKPLWQLPPSEAKPSNISRRRTNVQQLTCKIDLSNSFYYLFFSFVILELKPFVFKGKVLGEKF